MAKGKPYSNIQDIINGIATGEVNAQNYEELLKALKFKSPEEYALKKSHIEDAIKAYSRNLTAQQANNLSPIIANTTILKRGLDNLIEKMQAAKQQENPSAVRQIQNTIRSMPADSVWENAPQVVQSPRKNIIDPASINTGYDFGIPIYNPPNTSNIYGNITNEGNPVTVDSAGTSDSSNPQSKQTAVNPSNIPDDASKIYAGLAQIADEVFFKKPQDSTNPITASTDIPAPAQNESVKTPQAKQSVKASKKEQGLQKLTSDISATSSEQPRTTNILDASIPTSAVAAQFVPEVIPSTAPPIDDSYYRYLRNNGWNDFDARRQAIRYY